MPLPGPFRLWQADGMNRLAVSSLALLIVACSGEPPAAIQTESSVGATASGNDAAAATGPVESEPAGPQSRYTPLKNCKVVESKPEEDWSVSRCMGPGGFAVFVDYGDARDDLRLILPGGKRVPLALIALGGGGFNSLGDMFEWRGIGAGAAFEPTALIVRNQVVTSPERPEQMAARLVVVDLKQACVVAQIEPRPAQNEAARAVADGTRQPCLKVGS